MIGMTFPRLSWGEAGLAELYLALDDVSRGKTASFDAFQFALEVYFVALLVTLLSVYIQLFPFLHIYLSSDSIFACRCGCTRYSAATVDFQQRLY